jgi:hypothetical protein
MNTLRGEQISHPTGTPYSHTYSFYPFAVVPIDPAAKTPTIGNVGQTQILEPQRSKPLPGRQPMKTEMQTVIGTSAGHLRLHVRRPVVRKSLLAAAAPAMTPGANSSAGPTRILQAASYGTKTVYRQSNIVKGALFLLVHPGRDHLPRLIGLPNLPHNNPLHLQPMMTTRPR